MWVKRGCALLIAPPDSLAFGLDARVTFPAGKPDVAWCPLTTMHFLAPNCAQSFVAGNPNPLSAAAVASANTQASSASTHSTANCGGRIALFGTAARCLVKRRPAPSLPSFFPQAGGRRASSVSLSGGE